MDMRADLEGWVGVYRDDLSQVTHTLQGVFRTEHDAREYVEMLQIRYPDRRWKLRRWGKYKLEEL